MGQKAWIYKPSYNRIVKSLFRNKPATERAFYFGQRSQLTETGMKTKGEKCENGGNYTGQLIRNTQGTYEVEQACVPGKPGNGAQDIGCSEPQNRTVTEREQNMRKRQENREISPYQIEREATDRLFEAIGKDLRIRGETEQQEAENSASSLERPEPSCKGVQANGQSGGDFSPALHAKNLCQSSEREWVEHVCYTACLNALRPDNNDDLFIR